MDEMGYTSNDRSDASGIAIKRGYIGRSDTKGIRMKRGYIGR